MDNQQLKTLHEIREMIPNVICNRKELYRINHVGPDENETVTMNREEWLESHLEYVMDTIGIVFYEELEQFSSKEKEQRSIEGGKD